MKKLLLFIFASLLSLFSLAQYNENAVNPKARSLYNIGIDKSDNNQLPDAISYFNAALKIEPRFVEAMLSKAGVYGEMKDYKSSVENYEKAREIDSSYFKFYNLPYAINLAGIGKFEDALKAINIFLTIPTLNDVSVKAGNYRKRCFLFALDYKTKHSNSNYVFAPVNLGDSINTKESEYFPSLTIDGRELVFTRRVNNVNEDFFHAYSSNNKWSAAKPLEGNINTDRNEGAQNISQDGKWLVFTKCNDEQGYGSCDIFYSIITNNGWTEPKNIGNKINTEFWETQPCLSPDNRDLYFVSRQPDGYGGSDIYVSHRTTKGWTVPENLGPTINTVGDESGPFIHADNQTLFFTSNGHPGYGGDDLFMSRKNPDGSWGTPVNLGYPLNTIDNEGSLFIASDGKTAFYAGDRFDTKGGLDIYTFELADDVRPFRTTWISGKVYDKKTNIGLPSAVELIDLQTKLLIAKVQTDEEGNYFITLPMGKDYAFNVNRKGYLFYSGNYSLSSVAPDTTFNVNIPLQPIEVNATVVLKNIFFDVNKFDLKPASLIELDRIVDLLKDNPTVKLQINGHTDNSGNEKDNQALSLNRAKAVVSYIGSKGITADRLSFRGYGSVKPIADNKTEDGRSMNRRTEMQVIGK